MNKGLSSIGGLLIAFLIAAVASTIVWTYYTLTTTDISNSSGSDVVISSGTKTAAETAATKDWKTYTNSRVNYSVKYPNTATVNETIKYPSARSTDAQDEDLSQIVVGQINYSIEARVGITESTIENWIKGDSSYTDKIITNYTKTTVDSKTAYISKSGLATYVMSGKNVYKIVAYQGNAPKTGTDETYTNMLSTFKFTK